MPVDKLGKFRPLDDDTNDTLDAIAGLVTDPYDYISLTWTDGNPTTIIFKDGGASGVTIATLTLTWDSDDNPLTITKT
jgi:hypothetical protein